MILLLLQMGVVVLHWYAAFSLANYPAGISLSVTAGISTFGLGLKCVNIWRADGRT